MSGLAELAAVMMSGAQDRIEVAARNVSNMNTPGFQAQRQFQQIVDARQAMPESRIATPGPVGQPGIRETGRAFDLALTGGATLLLRNGQSFEAVRSAQLDRDGEGRLIDDRGRVLQASGGGDLTIGSGTATILRDGTVLIDGRAEARIGMFVAEDGIPASTSEPARKFQTTGADFAFTESDRDGVIHQGMLIASNVNMAREMVALTQAGRMAETGAKIFELYDDLLGKAASQLGSMGR